jgi:hypothetical protein
MVFRTSNSADCPQRNRLRISQGKRRDLSASGGLRKKVILDENQKPLDKILLKGHVERVLCIF